MSERRPRSRGEALSQHSRFTVGVAFVRDGFSTFCQNIGLYRGRAAHTVNTRFTVGGEIAVLPPTTFLTGNPGIAKVVKKDTRIANDFEKS